MKSSGRTQHTEIAIQAATPFLCCSNYRPDCPQCHRLLRRSHRQQRLCRIYPFVKCRSLADTLVVWKIRLDREYTIARWKKQVFARMVPLAVVVGNERLQVDLKADNREVGETL